MADYDIIIKSGTIVDGTRTPRYVGDLAIKDGKIAQIGGLKGKTADRILDATGRIVAPGFIDLHTHYDAQIFWDPYCTLSGWHGVTSVALGNCGFGFAPSRAEDRDRAMLSMTRNEAIPYDAMKAGMPWNWITFPDFIERVSRPKEFHLRPLAEPDVNLSAHPAPTIQPTTDTPSTNERTHPVDCARGSLSVSAARVLWPASLLCLRMSHRIRNRFMLRHTGLSADP